jgi:hypothetical protein
MCKNGSIINDDDDDDGDDQYYSNSYILASQTISFRLRYSNYNVVLNRRRIANYRHSRHEEWRLLGCYAVWLL